MNSFDQFDLPKPIKNAIADLGFDSPTPMQEKAFNVIRSGKDMVGIAQTGTGKTLAYILPILKDLKFSNQIPPRVVILVPTRELVLQVVEMTESVTKYMNVRVLGVFGGKNINVQKLAVSEGTDILVATPGRLFDIAVSGILQLKTVKKLVIDEVDIMLDEGFRTQLKNILELLPKNRQNIMFSATMTDEVDVIIDDYFIVPTRISMAISGTPLANIEQQSFLVPNFHTKVNLLSELVADKNEFSKVLVFVSGKNMADRLFEIMQERFPGVVSVIHGNKSQNYRIKSIKQFEAEKHRILIATDVLARGLDFNKISHVINFDTPAYAENYIHRIGRTGRAEEKGKSILFFTEKERKDKEAIEKMMDYSIPLVNIPDEVEISNELIAEERPEIPTKILAQKKKDQSKGDAFHNKSLKNQKTNQGGSYRRKKKKHKSPITRGDKIANRNMKR
ncbi:MAG: DEAD/DEAH box helicase [Bacteroidetes bacterium GWF2_38_335]|nr:MAG: DEAD/DEAH box helicase [Bacteroidetes bacterium GWF2_38_335]OFY78257.1 MAG: DEAD/DEAH box helicase [Bacteroidetes bacterium RIFOXYA12_FULL_38_20]HBS87550.1 DEAD/DEAH box helicase [Bacteroidales bacterium]